MSLVSSSGALVPWAPQPEPSADQAELPVAAAILSLLEAARRLAFRGSGPAAWAAPLTDDPIAFLLDSTSDAVTIWSSAGRLVYANDAATDIGSDEPPPPGLSILTAAGRELERRCLHFRLLAATYVVEIVRPRAAPTR